jgi:hypothetical protein
LQASLFLQWGETVFFGITVAEKSWGSRVVVFTRKDDETPLADAEAYRLVSR